MRVARRRRLPVPPREVGRRLTDPRTWAPLFVSPDAAAPRRVKVLDGGARAAPGIRLQLLRQDHTWTIYRVLQWAPDRQVRLLAERHGTGQDPGAPIPGEQVERLILIPQSDETEAEWTLDRRGALLTRLLSEKGPDLWADALDARLEVLDRLVTGYPRPED